MGKRFQPGMSHDSSWDPQTSRLFNKAKREYGKAHPEWAKKDRLAYFQSQVKKMQNE